MDKKELNIFYLLNFRLSEEKRLLLHQKKKKIVPFYKFDKIIYFTYMMNSKKNIINLFCLLYTLTIALSGCSDTDGSENENPQNIILSADKNEFKSDGNEIVTFSIHADGKDISSYQETEIIYKEENYTLSGKTFSTNISGIHHFYAKYKGLRSPEIQINARPTVLVLSADMTLLKANGKNSVTFSVTADGENVTGDAEFFYQNGDTEVVLKNNTFTTEKVGLYEFHCRYKEQVSNAITITATPFVLTLTSDKTTIKTGEEVTFTAISDDMTDVSSSIALHVTCNGKEDIFDSNTFTPSSFGSYSIYATFEERISNVIEIEVIPASVTISVDKNILKSTGIDAATFSVLADGIQVNDAEIYMRGEPKDTKLTEYQFSTYLQGAYSFYAQYAGIQSEDIGITVHLANFYKQSCAMEVVATWCGYSPQMISAFHQVKEQYSDRIHIISLHRSNSGLGSTDVDAEDFLEYFNWSGVPFGILDLSNTLPRSAEKIRELSISMKQLHPATSGIAIVSEKTDNSINVKLKVKVNETDEYRLYAFIVEDNVVKRQTIYINGSKDNTVWDDNYVNHAVATYTMPGYKPYAGKPLGVIQNGEEVTGSFSIPLGKTVTDRAINYSNCRVVAYTLKKSGDQYYINNTATCQINGSVDYKYEE